ncbi:MAG: polysaccharide deacetylase family protein [Humibacter sp.]
MTPGALPWPSGAPAAFAMTVDVDGATPHLWESRTGRPRLAELEQRLYGPRRGIWRLLDVFAEADVTGSFYIPGVYAEQNPYIVRAIAERGHEIGLHGWMHEPPAELSRDAFRDTTQRALDTLRELTGDSPVTGYRSPGWDMTYDAFDVLRELGITYDSSMMGDDRPYRVGAVSEIPVSWVLDDAPFYRYVGGESPGHPPLRSKDVVQRWADEVDAAARYGTLAVLTVHDWLSGRPAPAAALSDLLAHVRDRRLWIATCAELAGWHDTREQLY